MPERPLAFVLAAPHSGGGKTTVSLALAVALKRQGLTVHGCKCGPDYVDPTFMSQACGHPCLNVDTWLMGEEGVRAVFARQAEHADVVLVEGVMGLMDGREPGSLTGSTLDVARVLDLPVILVVHARGMAGSIAPLADGFARACSRVGVRLAGIIATCTGSQNHVAALRLALEQAHLPPLLLTLPRREDLALPSRQLGLVPAEEVAHCTATLDRLGALIAAGDLERLTAAVRAARVSARAQAGASLVSCTKPESWPAPEPCTALAQQGHCVQAPKKRLAIARDEAFCFYYEENFRLLRELGWETVFFSPLRDTSLPPADALYLGGGYPEVFAARLAANSSMRASLCSAAMEGLPVYAECGGYMYLAQALTQPEKGREGDVHRHAMVGLVNGTARMGSRLRSLGYREASFLVPLPFGLDVLLNEVPHNVPDGAPDGVPDGRRIVRGHEFHWSDMELHEAVTPLYTTVAKDGTTQYEGLVTGPYHNVLASYLHAYFPSLLFLNRRGQTDRQSAPVSARASGRALAWASPGHVLVLSGPSSAGKTSLGREVSRELTPLGIPHVLLSLDTLLSAFVRGNRPCFSLQEAEDAGVWSAHAYHVLLRDTARHNLVICDHVLCGNAAWCEDLAHTLAGVTVLAVELDCPADRLLAREEQRTDRPGFADHVLAQLQAQRAAPLSLPGSLHLASGTETPQQLCCRLLDLLDAD